MSKFIEPKMGIVAPTCSPISSNDIWFWVFVVGGIVGTYHSNIGALIRIGTEWRIVYFRCLSLILRCVNMVRGVNITYLESNKTLFLEYWLCGYTKFLISESNKTLSLEYWLCGYTKFLISVDSTNWWASNIINEYKCPSHQLLCIQNNVHCQIGKKNQLGTFSSLVLNWWLCLLYA
jgi:hypothetical protein